MKIKQIQVSLVCPICLNLVSHVCVIQDKYEPDYTFTCNTCSEEFLFILNISSQEKE